ILFMRSWLRTKPRLLMNHGSNQWGRSLVLELRGSRKLFSGLIDRIWGEAVAGLIDQSWTCTSCVLCSLLQANL
ncbi:hypothetical protein J1N35_011416, partial [Gossypium stocksii]